MSRAADISLGKQTFTSTVARFAMAAVGFVGTIIFARELGPAAFGGVYLLLGLVKLADRPMNGWSLAAKKRLSESDSIRSAALGSQLLFDGAWVALVGVATLFAAGWLRGYTGLAAAPLLLVVMLLSESLFESLESLLQGRGFISVGVWIDALRSYLTLALQLALVFALGLGAAGMVYGLAAASALSVPLVLRYVDARPTLPSGKLTQSLWEYARYSIPSTALGTVYDRLDVVLLGLLLSPAAAGYYEVAWKLTIPAVFMADVAGMGLMAKVSGRAADGSDVGEDVTNTVSFTGLLAIPMFFGVLAFAKPLVITLYGPAYAAAAPLLVGLAAFRLLRTQSGPLLQAVNGLNRPDIGMRLSAAALVSNIVLGVAFILWFGPVGVVVATVLAESIRYLGSLGFLFGELDAFNPITRPLIEQVGASIVMYAAVTVAHAYVPIRSWVDLLVLVGLGAGVYGAVLLAVSSSFRLTLRSVYRELSVGE